MNLNIIKIIIILTTLAFFSCSTPDAKIIEHSITIQGVDIQNNDMDVVLPEFSDDGKIIAYANHIKKKRITTEQFPISEFEVTSEVYIYNIDSKKNIRVIDTNLAETAKMYHSIATSLFWNKNLLNIYIHNGDVSGLSFVYDLNKSEITTLENKEFKKEEISQEKAKQFLYLIQNFKHEKNLDFGCSNFNNVEISEHLASEYKHYSFDNYNIFVYQMQLCGFNNNIYFYNKEKNFHDVILKHDYKKLTRIYLDSAFKFKNQILMDVRQLISKNNTDNEEYFFYSYNINNKAKKKIKLSKPCFSLNKFKDNEILVLLNKTRMEEANTNNELYIFENDNIHKIKFNNLLLYDINISKDRKQIAINHWVNGKRKIMLSDFNDIVSKIIKK